MTTPLAFPADSFLGMMEAADRAALIEAGRPASHPAGETILHEGGRPLVVLLVLQGTVKLVKVSMGGRVVVLELRGPGHVIGELGAVDGRPHSAGVVALDEVEVRVLPADRFVALYRQRSGVASALVTTLAARVREAAGRQLERGASDVLGRVCQRLSELAASHGRVTPKGVLVQGALSQQELADWCGTTRDGAVRALAELRRLGWLETGRQRLLLLDADSVRARAESGPDD